MLDRHWDVLSVISSPDTEITFEDYVAVEEIMELWYSNGKLAATGHAYGDFYDYE
jgi:hypothetical protein